MHHALEKCFKTLHLRTRDLKWIPIPSETLSNLQSERVCALILIEFTIQRPGEYILKMFLNVFMDSSLNYLEVLYTLKRFFTLILFVKLKTTILQG